MAVTSIERIRAPTRVYNLTVAPTPTYFAHGLAVHNKAPADGAAGTGTSVGGCFLAGTRIRLADGSTKPIEAIEVGERVRAFDPKTGELTTSRVVRTLDRRVGDSYRLTFANGARVQVTGEHPVFTPAGRFVKVK